METEFIFNQNNVCLNPNKTVIIVNKTFEMSIETAQYFGMYWCYGWHWSFLNMKYGYEGSGTGASIPTYPSMYRKHHFDTEEEALKCAKKMLYSFFSDRSEWVKGKDPVFGEILKALNAVEKPKQLDLFELA